MGSSHLVWSSHLVGSSQVMGFIYMIEWSGIWLLVWLILILLDGLYWWIMMDYHDGLLMDYWWIMMDYDGLWWIMMDYDGLWWIILMDYDGLWWILALTKPLPLDHKSLNPKPEISLSVSISLIQYKSLTRQNIYPIIQYETLYETTPS